MSNLHKRVWRPLMNACELIRYTGSFDENGEREWEPLFSPYALRHFYASMLIKQ